VPNALNCTLQNTFGAKGFEYFTMIKKKKENLAGT
jgi:hypothetical protein